MEKNIFYKLKLLIREQLEKELNELSPETYSNIIRKSSDPQLQKDYGTRIKKVGEIANTLKFKDYIGLPISLKIYDFDDTIVNTKIIGIEEAKNLEEGWTVKIKLNAADAIKEGGYKEIFIGLFTINIEEEKLELFSNISGTNGFNSKSNQNTQFEVDLPTKKILQKIASIYGITDINLPRFK
jgi:hypothetical protein